MATIDQLIAKDHEYIRSMYRSCKNETDPVEKQKYANEFVRILAVHSVSEELCVYPSFGGRLAHGEETSQHSREEHLEIKNQLYRLDQMKASQRGFDEQLDRVMAITEKHVKEEEEVILPKLIKTMYEQELVELGKQFETYKKRVPTHSHPWAPDKPPFETIVGALQAPLDKMYDWFARDYPAKVEAESK